MSVLEVDGVDLLPLSPSLECGETPLCDECLLHPCFDIRFFFFLSTFRLNMVYQPDEDEDAEFFNVLFISNANNFE